MNEASRSLQTSDPALALTLNPVNTDASVNLIVAALNAVEAVDIAALQQQAAGLVATTPADARGYSLMGAIADRQGDADRAQALYGLALQHSKSELHALMRTAVARLQQDDLAGALEHIDLLLRRWPNYWDSASSIVVRMAEDPRWERALAAQLERYPPWRGQAIAGLARAGSIDFLVRLLAGMPPDQRETPAARGERNTVVTSLLNAGQPAGAHALFTATLTEAERAVAGLVFDGSFSLPPGTSPFAWRVQRQGATEVRQGPVGSSASGLAVIFLDSPARPGIVSQRLAAPPGRYRLSLHTQAVNLRAPRDLFWSVRCEGGPVLLRLDVPVGSTQERLEADLEVPATGCGLQALSLDTSVRTESWRDRYQGEARFTDLALTPL